MRSYNCVFGSRYCSSIVKERASVTHRSALGCSNPDFTDNNIPSSGGNCRGCNSCYVSNLSTRCGGRFCATKRSSSRIADSPHLSPSAWSPDVYIKRVNPSVRGKVRFCLCSIQNHRASTNCLSYI